MVDENILNLPPDMIGKKLCVKCDQAAKFTGVDPKKAWYCKECFITMVRNKFRSTISKRKIYKNIDSRKTIIVFDGTQSASYLLHQIDDAVRQVNFKRLMIEPFILVLVSTTDLDQIQIVIDRVKEMKTMFPENINWLIAHLACCLNFQYDDITNDKCYGLENIDQYNKVLDSIKCETYKQEFMRILKEKCLRNISKKLGIDKVMLSDDADELGRATLAQLCLGRGGSLSPITSVVDKRQSVTFIRPLRDISKKEIGVVNHLCGYASTAIQLNGNKTAINSVQTLTDKFVNNLESENFHSTINTVLSTAAKIHNTDDGDLCNLCEIEPVNQKSLILCETCCVIKSFCMDDSLDLVLTK